MTSKTETLASALQSAVNTYPQMSEDEPGGYCTAEDQLMDEAAAELRRLAAEVEALREHAVTLANTTFLTTVERCAQVCEAHYNHEAKDCAEEIRALKDQA